MAISDSPPPIAHPTALPELDGYQIVETLYCGSRTAVYRALRTTDHCPVAIKLLKRDYPSFSELVQFRNQYTIAKALNLPGIIQPYSLEPYRTSHVLIMEDFGGTSLRHFTKHQRLSLQQFFSIALQLVETLHQLHQQQVIHKDIKPANILIHSDTEQVKLIDFSIASLLPRETQEIQNPNGIEGTLAYLSPEQTGRMNRGIDYRSDYYSLGVTFFELLTGQLPFQSNEPMEVVHCHIAKLPLSVCDLNPDLPLMLGEIIRKLMAKNAEERYQSSIGLKHDLLRCQEEWLSTGKSIWFALGQRDVSDRFFIPEKLYGREQEVESLLNAFGRVANGAAELLLVAGFSGIGKTAVVNEVHKPIVRWNGYFIKGKYDQFQCNIPFSAFVQAFRDLMGQLLSETDEQLAQWKDKILAAVGENGQALIEVIPELEQIIGKQSPVPELSGCAAQNRFNLLFQKFVQVFTALEHPLVMFLDDLHWADSASLNLMQVLMNQSNRGYLLMIGAYRNNEVFPAHPLMLTLNEMSKAEATLSTLILAPLSQTDINHLIADTLSCSIPAAQPLSELVYQKTQGNPFFTTQFLKALHKEGYIAYDLQVGHWQCDMAVVRSLSLTDDVVELMALQIQKLPVATQNALKLAACIGNRFDLDTVAIVSEQSQAEAATHLWKALQEGLILPTSQVYKFFQGAGQFWAEEPVNPTYRFLHDRVQQAAYSLIPEAERAIAHYQIGQLLLQQFSPSVKEDRIFELVNQLNYGISLIVKQQERDDLAQLNLMACRKARAATAYQAARNYATVGLCLLGENAWQQQYDISLAFHEIVAEVAMLCGDFEAMEQSIDSVTKQAHSLLEQVNVYCIKIQGKTSQRQLNEVLAIGIKILQQLGVTIIESPTPAHIQRSIQEVSELIGDRQVEDFADLPVMTDTNKIAITRIASSIMAAAYTCGSLLYPLLATLLVKLFLRHGNISVSATSYACYSLVLCNMQKNIDLAAQFGQLALNVASKFNDKATKLEVFFLLGSYILHRKSHLKEMLPLLSESYTLGLEVGNLEYAGYAAHNFCLISSWCGQPLTTLEQDTRTYYNALVQLKQLGTANYCLLYWQVTLNLLGLTEHPTILSGSALQETKFLPLLESVNDVCGLYIFYSYKLTLCFLFEEIELANNYALECRKYFMSGAGTVAEPAFYFYDSLVALALLIQQSVEGATALERVAENQAKLQHWAHYAPMNHQHKVTLVEAEKCRVLGQTTEAIELYDKAIALAKANEYIHEAALANELAAKFYLNWGKERIAQNYLIEAYYGYARWGAKAKVADLETCYPRLLAPILQQTRMPLSVHETVFAPGNVASSSSSTSISDSLDLATILKASQTLSSEIELDKFLASLLSIVIKDMGANRCVMMLLRDNRLLIKGAVMAGAEPVVLQRLPIEESQDIPLKLIYKVKHDQQTVVLVDASAAPTLANDPYIVRQQPRSILCSPILHQGKLMGILYLENSLVTGAFTTDRVELLNLLCAQAAISLENARLYERSQQYAQRLEDALNHLQNAQLQIVQSEKMSALGNLVAGVAHEINNPIGFIAGNLQPALDYVKDIFGLIKLYQQEYPHPNPLIQEEMEAIDLEYIWEDLPKLIDSMKLGVDRIRSISTSLRTFSRADKDYKVPFNIHEGIDSTILILKHRLKANDDRPAIDVITDYDNLPAIDCFPGQLNQVFMNILANAIDALEEANQTRSDEELKAHPNRIEIQTRWHESEQLVVIQIRDNGIGMSDEVKQRAFNHLFTTKAVGKGTGLGLAIAQQIICQQHQGQIEIRSHLGQGTVFELTLPAQQN